MADDKGTETVTDDQAEKALFDLMGTEPDGTEREAPAPEEQPVPEETAQEETEKTEEPQSQEVIQEEVQEDDLESLRSRLEKTEAEAVEREKAAAARVEAMKERFAENEKILRERYLRKSTVADKARKILEGAISDVGVERDDAERVIRELQGTMNPESASYVPPEDPASREDQALVLNRFLNEKGMNKEEAQAFGTWVQTEAPAILTPEEGALADRDLDGFLRVALHRYAESARDKEQKKEEAVAAVKVVKKTQREAARAATSTTAAPKKQPAGSQETDTKNLTKDDVSTLLRKSVTQYH